MAIFGFSSSSIRKRFGVHSGPWQVISVFLELQTNQERIMTSSQQQQVKNQTAITIMIGVVTLMGLSSLSNAAGWELRTTEQAVPGTSHIESGNVDKAIRIAKVRLPHASPQVKVAYFTNLCIGYIMKNDFQSAEVYCDEAVKSSTERVVSYNNRGVLKALQGDYIGAMDDFSSAASAGCVRECNLSANAPRDLPRPTARRNLSKAEMQAQAISRPEK
jgi:hypothetical protein